MADNLEPVNQEFTSNFAPYIAEMREAIEEAKKFAQENTVASEAVDRVRDDSATAADEVRKFGTANAEATAAISDMRDKAVEDGVALSDIRDHAREAASEEKKLRDASVEAGTAMGHVRDEALVAAESVKKLGTSAEETAAKLDLMSLSGLSSFGALGPLLGIIGALVVAAAAVAPALLSFGLGIGAFGAFAIPTIKAVTGALGDTKKQLAALPPGVREVVGEIKSLEAEFKTLSKAFQPEVLALMDDLLSMARQLLPIVVPMAQQGAIAAQMLVGALQKGIASSGFTSFMRLMTSMVVPATHAIIGLAGALLGTLGKALTVLAPMSVPFINVLSSLIRALSGPLAAVLGVVVKLFLGLASAITPLLPGISALATVLINDIGASFEEFIPIIRQVVGLLGGAFLQIFRNLQPIIANALTPNSPFISALRIIPEVLRVILPMFVWLSSLLANKMFARIAVDIISAIIAFKAAVAVIGMVRNAMVALDVVMAANPVGAIIVGIIALVAIFAYLWTHFAGFRDFWIATWRAISDVAKAAWGIISAIVKSNIDIVVGEVKVGLTIIESVWTLVWGLCRDTVRLVWGLISGEIRTAIDLITGVIRVALDIIEGHWGAAWNQILSTTRQFLNNIKSTILNLVSNFSSLLYDAGRNLISGLIRGVTSAVGGLMSTISGIAGNISSAFSSVLHILSPSMVFHNHGLMIMQGLANGILAGYSMVHDAISRVATSVSAAPLGASAAGVAASAGGGGTIHATVPITVALGAGTGGLNSPAFMQYLQTVVQEAVLRFTISNPQNGFGLPGKMS